MLKFLIVIGSVVVGGFILLVGFTWVVQMSRKRTDRKAIEEATSFLAERGITAEKINVGSRWYVAHFLLDGTPAKARFTFHPKSGIEWEGGRFSPIRK